MERKGSISLGGTIIFLALIEKTLTLGKDTGEVFSSGGIYSTVKKGKNKTQNKPMETTIKMTCTAQFAHQAKSIFDPTQLKCNRPM